MALIAKWLLNGDLLDSSGNGNHGSINGSALTYVDGVVGKAGVFDGNKNIAIQNTDFFLSKLKGDFTICFLIKPTHDYVARRDIFCLGRDVNSGINIRTDADEFIYASLFTDKGRWSAGIGVVLNEWSHIAFRFSNKGFQIFLNGVLADSVTEANGTIMYPEVYGGFCTLASHGEIYKYLGQLQDFRIYDHCLSDKEIYDLSKAKVLHLTFDDVEEPTVNLFPQKLSSLNITDGTNWSEYYDNNNDYILRYDRLNTELYSYKGVDIAVNAGESITFSLDLFISSEYDRANGIIFRFENASYTDYILNDLLKGCWNKCKITTTIESSGVLRCLLYPSPETTFGTKGYILFKNVQVEKKDHATPFVNGTRDQIIVRDKSDYGNDSLPLTVATTPAFVDDCKVGKLGTAYSVVKDDYIALPNLGTKDKYSISFWAYKNNTAGMPFGTSHGKTFYWYGTNSYQYTHGGTSGEWYYNSGDTINNWNHYVVTYDGTKVEVFINGVSKGTKSSAGSAVLNALCIGSAYTTHADTTYYSIHKYNGKVDDFRIYATALTPEDIKEIYQSRANLDDKGNLSVVSLKQQGATSISLTEKGVYNTVEISEVGVTEGLIAWYPLNGDSKDYSGNGNDGVVYGATVAAGLWQKCYSFDGVDDKILAETSISGDPIFTISMWVKRTSDSGTFTGRSIFGLGSVVGSRTNLNTYNPNRLHGISLDYYGSDTIDSMQDYPLNQWCCVVFVKKGLGINLSSVDIYIDGEKCNCQMARGGTGSINIDGKFSIGSRLFGSTQAGEFAYADIQDVRIYNRALTSEEVLISYNLTKADKTAMIQSENGTTYVNKIKEV